MPKKSKESKKSLTKSERFLRDSVSVLKYLEGKEPQTVNEIKEGIEYQGCPTWVHTVTDNLEQIGLVRKDERMIIENGNIDVQVSYGLNSDFYRMTKILKEYFKIHT